MKPSFRQKSSSTFIVLLMGMMASQTTIASTWHVSMSQTNSPPDGTAWATAFPTVQQALNVATNGDSVWVSRGTYFENITLSNGVALYGGFVGTEIGLEARDWITNITVLDGRQSNTVVTVAQGSTNTTRIDGFTIRNGRASNGGGISCSSSSPTIANNRILWNTATNNGAGIYVSSGSPLISSNLIQGNTAIGDFSAGAGIGCVNSSVTILNNRITANSAKGGSFFGSAGGIACSSGGSPQIYNNLILANSVQSAPFATGAVLLRGTTAPKVVNNTISQHRSFPAGSAVIYAIYCDTNTATIANNIVAFCSRGISGVEGMNFRNNCVFGNGVNFSGFADPTGTNGNISIDPQFVSNVYYPGTHLTAGSPCRDAGDSSLVQVGLPDTDGGSRIVGASVDIGADEFEGDAPTFTTDVVRVSTTGDDENVGKTWTSSKRTVQAAIDQSAFTGGEIWVQAGVYTNNLTLRSFANLLGGFAGNELNSSQRNWKTNVTILDGGQAGSVIRATSIQSWGTIDGFVIRNGRAQEGAGVYCSDSSPNIANNTITNNIGSGTSSLGAGIHLYMSSPLVTKNIISFNRAAWGGGLCCYGNLSTPAIAKNWFESNYSLSGSVPFGGLANGGGGIFVLSFSTPVVDGNCFLGNVASNLASSSIFSGQGGGICIASDAKAQILNNTLIANIASVAHGPYLENGGGVYSGSPSALIANNIIAFGSSGIYAVRFASNTTSSNIQNNCVYGNTTNYLRMSDLTGTNGNISVNPLLLNAADFHLSPNSPCINSGNTNFVGATTDFDGSPRVFGGPVDIGAHEFQTPGSVISYAWLQQYGLPTDGSVDHIDTDDDGFDNWLEWHFNSSPIDPVSTPGPRFTRQPMSASQVFGLPATMSVDVAGASPISLQWQFNGYNILGATGAVLNIPSFQNTNVGNYSVAATNTYGYAISSNGFVELGQIAAWGQTGPTPTGATNLLAVSGGYDHALLLKIDGTVRGWDVSGTNLYGETSIPSELSNVVAIAAGYNTSLALQHDGHVVAWGLQNQAAIPQVATNLAAIALGKTAGSDHGLGLYRDGQVLAWGNGSYGENIAPSYFSNVVAIASGANHNIILRRDGSVSTWPNDIIPNPTNVIAVVAGFFYNVVLRADGTVLAWANTTTTTTVATNVPSGLSNVVAIAGGGEHCLALKADGTVVAWGDNTYGQTNVPAGLTNVVSISAGAYHSLALVGDGPPVQQTRLSAPTLGSNGFSIDLMSQSGRVFALEHASFLANPTWVSLPLVAGNGTNLTLLDSTTTNTTQRFYRVRRW